MTASGSVDTSESRQEVGIVDGLSQEAESTRNTTRIYTCYLCIEEDKASMEGE